MNNVKSKVAKSLVSSGIRPRTPEGREPNKATEETDTVRRMFGAGRQIGEMHERVRDLAEIF